MPVFFKVCNDLSKIKKKDRSCLHLLIFFSALKDSSLGNTNAIMNSSPLFVMIIGVLFLREKFTITRRISFVTLIAGCILIAIPKSDITSSLSFKVLFTVLTYNLFVTSKNEITHRRILFSRVFFIKIYYKETPL